MRDQVIFDAHGDMKYLGATNLRLIPRQMRVPAAPQKSDEAWLVNISV
jgi:hypothetical protein